MSEKMSLPEVKRALITQELEKSGEAGADALEIQKKLEVAATNGTIEQLDPGGNLRIAVSAKYAQLQKNNLVRPIADITDEAKKIASSSDVKM